MSFARPPILDTDACLEFVNSLEYGKEHGPLKNLEECGKAEAVWSCLHEIYPSWFDESLHPSNFATPEEALSQILYYLDEFHENKYAADFKVITDNINHFLSGDPSLILKTYEFLLLATIHGEGQQIIAKIMEMSQSTQTLIQTILQEHADINEGDTSSSLSNTARSFSRTLSDAIAAGGAGTTSRRGLSIIDGGGGGGGLSAVLQKVQDELHQVRADLRKTKTALTESESQKETLMDKLKLVEGERDQAKTKCTVLEKQLAAKTDVLVKDFAEQIEDSDKTIAKLKEDIENERKEKKKMEEKSRAVVAELKEEIGLLKQEARRVSSLEVQIQNYKNKLTELTVLKEKMSKLELQNKAYMDKIVEAESDSLGAMGLRKQVDSYKEKVADAEERLSTVLAEKDALVKLKEEVEKQVSTIEKKLEVKELEIAQLHATIEAKDFEISNMSEKLKDIDKHQGRDIVGDLEALEREKKKSGAESAAKIVELTNELDDLKRVKQRLEKNNAVYLAQIAVLQKELSTGLNGGVDAQKFQELVTKTAKQEEEIKQLQESKDEMARQMMEALAKRAEGGGTTGGEDKDENAAAALVKVALLETQLEAERKQASMREDLIRSKVEKEMENVQSTLKTQLQIRERETNFYKKAVEENVESSKKEMKLLSSVLYEIGLRYHRLRAYCDQLKNENDAIQLRVKLYTEQGGERSVNGEDDDEGRSSPPLPKLATSESFETS